MLKILIKTLTMFQSTLLCKERLGFMSKIIFRFVSIHAPVQGATKNDIVHQWFRDVSIHAPVQGATTNHEEGHGLLKFQSTLLCKERLVIDQSGSNYIVFQSTLLCKERQSLVVIGACNSSVSIHAPVQGATCAAPSLICCPLFQSTLLCKERLQA